MTTLSDVGRANSKNTSNLIPGTDKPTLACRVHGGALGGHQVHRQEGGTSPVKQGSINDTSEEPTDVAEPLVPWLPSKVEERFGSRVSICAEVISPTKADRSDWKQCLLRTEAFELRLGAVAHPLSRQEEDSECPVVAVPRFRVCSARVCDQMPPALRLRELPKQWRRPHIRPGRRCFGEQQRR